MAGVNVVENGLPDEVIADRPRLQALFFQDVMAGFTVGGRVGPRRLRDIEMIAPAGQFYTVVTERLRFGGKRLKRQIGPLTGE